MQAPIEIFTAHLIPGDANGRVFDMTERCAFAVCLEGDFDVKIMNRTHRVVSHSILICTPYIRVEVLEVRRPSEVIFGGAKLEDVLATINRTVASSNLLAIRQHPVVCADPGQLSYIKSSVDEYLVELDESKRSEMDDTCRQIHKTIIEARSQLIVAQLLKLYFTNMPMEVRAHNHHDIVFQRFMLDLYANFRDNRNVKFYAMRSGLSIKYFSTIVHNLSGASPSEWIKTVVAGEAKMMLYNPKCNIKEIAASLNFPDASTFTKYFVRTTGITPRAFRTSIAR